MPFVSFTPDELLRGKVLTPGWYRMLIQSVGEQPSKDGNSTNYPVEGIVIRNADDGSEDFAGVPVIWNFNSKALGFTVGYFQALGIEIQPNTRYELKVGEGQQIDVFVENDTYNGRLVNRINHKYRPARG